MLRLWVSFGRDPDRNFNLIMKDGKIYKNTLHRLRCLATDGLSRCTGWPSLRAFFATRPLGRPRMATFPMLDLRY